MGVAVPEAARLVLLQEAKFKSFYNQLTYAVAEYEKLLARVPPITAALLKPHLEEMRRKLQPGMTTLTWTSMNIDAFMHSTYAAVADLDDLLLKMRDIIDNRIERNLKTVSKQQLVELPNDESFSLDKFVAVQDSIVSVLSAGSVGGVEV
jgi:dynein heavy chain, axonemal